MVYNRSQALIAGFAQFLSAPFGLGWIWAISHGMILVENAQLYDLIEEVEIDKDGIYGGRPKKDKKEDDEEEDENVFDVEDGENDSNQDKEKE